MFYGNKSRKILLKQFYKWKILNKKIKIINDDRNEKEDNFKAQHNYKSNELYSQKRNNNINIVTCLPNSCLEIFKKTNNCKPLKDIKMKTDRSFENSNAKSPRSNNTTSIIYKNPIIDEVPQVNKKKQNMGSAQEKTPSANRSSAQIKLAEDFSIDNGIANRTPSQLKNTDSNLFNRLYMVKI